MPLSSCLLVIKNACKGSHRIFRYLFGNAEDGALVEVVVAFGIAPRIEHDPDEAYQLVRHLLERVQ